MAHEHEGHRQRMKERFMQSGLEGFAPHEMLELLLFYGIPQRNVNPLAHRLMERFGSLHAVLEAPPEELAKVEGISMHTAVLLHLAGKLSREMEKSRSAKGKPITNRQQAVEYCEALLKGLREEHFYVVCLNGKMELIQSALIAKGTLDEVQAYPRQVAEAVLRCNAHSVVLCHNHPGGSCVPSQQDMEITRVLGAMLSNLNVALADHIIVAQNQSLSMVQYGLLQHGRTEDGLEMRVADSAGETRIRYELMKKEGIKVD